MVPSRGVGRLSPFRRKKRMRKPWAHGGPCLRQCPEKRKKMVVMDAADVAAVAAKSRLRVLRRGHEKRTRSKALEEAYAKAECPVVSKQQRAPFYAGCPDGRA